MASRALRTESDAANFRGVVMQARPLNLDNLSPSKRANARCLPQHRVAGSNADLLPVLLLVPRMGAEATQARIETVGGLWTFFDPSENWKRE